MANNDLVFKTVSDLVTIYDPLKVVTDSATIIRVTNFSTDDLTDLGLYVVPSTSLGSVDFPADFPPQTDYQDLMTWGQAVEAGLETVGGLKITVPQNSGTSVQRITRTQGALKSNKIPFIDLPAGGSADFTVVLETPPSVSARRLFINLVIE